MMKTENWLKLIGAAFVGGVLLVSIIFIAGGEITKFILGPVEIELPGNGPVEDDSISSSSTDEAPTYNPTQLSSEQTSEPDTMSIPSYEEKGIVWCTDYSGVHTIKYISGAYSPWPTDDGCDPKGCWKSAIFVYVNSNIDTIFNNAQGNPQNPHLRIGWNDWSPSISETEAKSESLESRSLNLQASDCLTFIAVDERESYHWPADNRGTVILQIQRP